VPFAVQAVVEKALSKKPEDRYPAVGDFHRELARAAGQTLPAPVPAPRPLPARELPPAEITTFGSTTGEVSPAATVTTRRSSRPLVVLAAAGLVVAAALVGSRILRTPPPPAPPAPLRTETPPPASLIQLDHLPPGAQVIVDGVVREPPFTVPRGSGVHRLRVVAPGYEPYEVGIDATRDKHTVLVTMKPLAPPPSDKPIARPARPRPSRARPAPTPSAETPPAPAPPKKKSKIITDI
jgi:hypothetical protein